MVTIAFKPVDARRRHLFTAWCGRCRDLMQVTAVGKVKEWQPHKPETLRAELEQRHRFDPCGARPHEVGVMLACGHQNNIMTSHRQLLTAGVAVAD